MVFYVRTRRGYEELVAFVGEVPSPIWVDRDVLTSDEIIRLREEGLNVTNFTPEPASEPDVSVIRMHHPNEVIWVEG